MTSSLCTRTPPAERARDLAAGAPRRGQGLLALAVLIGVVVVDQTTKWWAWRHVYAVVNRGGTLLAGSTVSSWCSGEVRGALLDLAGAQLLSLAAFGLLRRRRPLAVLLPALLEIGGWGSNLLDRLGLHLLTAPGIGRGAVDFIHLGRWYFNVADVCITAGTVLFGLALYRRHRRGGPGRTTGESVAAGTRPRPWRRARRWALLAALAPAVLGTTIALTASGGQVSAAAAPVVGLLNGG